jgi:hypothetical protein
MLRLLEAGCVRSILAAPAAKPLAGAWQPCLAGTLPQLPAFATAGRCSRFWPRLAAQDKTEYDHLLANVDFVLQGCNLTKQVWASGCLDRLAAFYAPGGSLAPACAVARCACACVLRV